MKLTKTLFITAAMLFASAALLSAESYKIEKISGKVTYESKGKWLELKEGQEIPSYTKISTSLNSSLVVSSGKTTATIKAMQKGTVEKLSSQTASTSGIKKNKINKLAGAEKAGANKNGVVTASSRASEAKGDLDWDE
ncbi:MAG: hypothetical protein K5873_07675 [Treponema sp.]|nr:hypothetical protein [Treponema sp.]